MERVCFLFGRSDTPQELSQELEFALRQQIAAGVRIFALGQWGGFETAVLALPDKLKEEQAISVRRLEDYAIPELKAVPKRFARRYAHQYMVERCGSVICCPFQSGNMQILLNIARRRGIPIAELGKNTPQGRSLGT